MLYDAWLREKNLIVLPKSPLGKAIFYALTLIDKGGFNPYFANALVPLDNNYMEAHIRPFVVGRKNWLFSDTPKGAHASSLLYSLIETAKANGIQPFNYLTLIFKELPRTQKLEDIEKLLPYNAARHFEIQKYKIL